MFLVINIDLTNWRHGDKQFFKDIQATIKIQIFMQNRNSILKIIIIIIIITLNTTYIYTFLIIVKKIAIYYIYVYI